MKQLFDSTRRRARTDSPLVGFCRTRFCEIKMAVNRFTYRQILYIKLFRISDPAVNNFGGFSAANVTDYGFLHSFRSDFGFLPL